MSIEVKVPKEITEYTEKIILGLNFRQLICTVLALVFGLFTYFIMLKVMNDDLAGYILMVVVFPIFAFGFYRKDGFTLEQYLQIRFRHYWSTSHRVYETELSIDKKGDTKNGNVKVKKTKDRKRETERFEFTKKEEKRRIKALRTAIKKARKEHKDAKQKFKKTSKNTKNTTNSPEYDTV